MSQSLANIPVHLVYSTKNRTPFLRDPALREEMFAYLVGVCNNLGCPSIRTGGWEDHVHILFSFARTITIADLVRDLKRSSSEWVKGKSQQTRHFQWQAGYAAFGIDPMNPGPVIEYIQNQDEHHRGQTFQDEYRGFCQRHNLPLDERYGWD
jgi:REP element-mobilizing transposase RayT